MYDNTKKDIRLDVFFLCPPKDSSLAIDSLCDFAMQNGKSSIARSPQNTLRFFRGPQ